MDPRDAFLQAIVERPDDDAPRLIYADWLEEPRRPPRRVHPRPVRWTRPWTGRTAGALEARQRQLLAAHRVAWSRPSWDLGCTLPGAAGDYGFRRGFIEDAEMDAAVFLGRSEELFRAAPLRRVKLNRVAGQLAELAASPWLERLAALILADNGIMPGGVRALAASPFLGGLAVLDLSNNAVGDEGAARLAESLGLTGLLHLHLGEAQIGPVGAARLAWGPNWPRLTELDLGGNRIGPAGAAQLAGSPRMARLTELNLDENGAGDSGAVGAGELALPRPPHGVASPRQRRQRRRRRRRWSARRT